MTFKQAQKKLAKIANGQYHSMEFGLTTFKGGKSEVDCVVYMHGYNRHHGTTWEAALAGLEREINPPPPLTDEEIYAQAPTMNVVEPCASR